METDPIELLKDIFREWKSRRKHDREIRELQSKRFWWVRLLKLLFWLGLLGSGLYWISTDLMKTAQVLSRVEVQKQVGYAETMLRQSLPTTTEAVSVHLLSPEYKYPASYSSIKESVMLRTDQPLGFEGVVNVMGEQYVGCLKVAAGEYPILVMLDEKVFLILPIDKIE